MSECDKYLEMISQLVDGELPEPHKTELVKHLGCCPDCRRVYDAFSAISLSLGETAAPEGFAGDVMAAVRTRGVHGSGRSKAPGKSLARYLALAACLVLAVLATVRLALPSGVRTNGAGAGVPQAAQFGVAAAPYEVDPRDAAGDEALPPAGNNEDVLPPANDSAENTERETPAETGEQDGAAVQETCVPSDAHAVLLDAGSISSIDISAEGLSKTITDEDDILVITSMLSPAGDAQPKELGEVYCSIGLNYETGCSTLNVYMAEDLLLCETGDGFTYSATASPAEFIAALG